MSCLPAEMAQCADCYAVLFADEMNQCAEGHLVCPGCTCDCTMLAETRRYTALWEAWEEALPLATGLRAAGHG